MAKILAVATNGTNDPTKSTFAFITAVGALGAGKEAAIALLGEAVYLVKKGADLFLGLFRPPPLGVTPFSTYSRVRARTSSPAPP